MKWLIFRRFGASVFAGATLLVACSSNEAGDDFPNVTTDGGITFDSSVVVVRPDASATDANANDANVDGGADTCSDGSPVVAEYASCPGSPPSVPASLSSALATATRGDIVSLGTAAAPESTAPCFPVRMCVPVAAPKMMFSDSPESPTTSGVLYADTVGPGLVRIYVYHTNGENDGNARKFPIVVLNQGATTAHATIVQKGIAGPSTDYVAVGKAAIGRWFASTAGSAIDVNAGTRILLDSDLDAVHAAHDELVHAIYDVMLDAPVKISVVSVLSTDDAAAITSTLSLLAADADHQRATFDGANRVIESEGNAPGDGIRKIALGGNDEIDPNLMGHDAVDGTSASLSGNYGVFYTLLIGAGAHEGFALVPRGGAWGGAGDLSVGEDGAAGAVACPSASDSANADGSAVSAGRFASGTNVRMHLISAGGSSLPVHVAVVPIP
jgi:hypothetical protein